MPRTQGVSDFKESPLRMLVITGPRPPANAAVDLDTFRATDVLENLEPTLALCCNGKDERDAHLSLSTMNRNALGIAPLNEVDTDRVTARLQRLGVRREPLLPVSRRSPAKTWTTPPASPTPCASASASTSPAFAPIPAKET